jgi:hypothetical protein
LIFAALLGWVSVTPAVFGQGMLKNLKNKANEVMDKAADYAIDNEVEKKTGFPANGGNIIGGIGKPEYKKGAGLTNT